MRKKEPALCEVNWCIAPRARRSTFCVVHKAMSQYDPGPAKGSLKRVWDRVPVSEPPIEKADEDEA